jgi:predicted membrane chloride channel (bestrophin family)
MRKMSAETAKQTQAVSELDQLVESMLKRQEPTQGHNVKMVYSTKDFTRTSEERPASPPDVKKRLLEWKKPEVTKEQVEEKLLKAMQNKSEAIRAKLGRCTKQTQSAAQLRAKFIETLSTEK